MQNQQEKEGKLHRQRKRLEMMENNPFFSLYDAEVVRGVGRQIVMGI